MDKGNWKVRFDTFLTHIRHNIEKGVDIGTYKWQNIVIETNKGGILVTQAGQGRGAYPLEALGTEEQHSQDNRISYNLVLTNENGKGKIATLTNGNNATIEKQENKTMQKSQAVVNNVTNTLKTVGQQIAESAKTSAKMEAGEAILLALRNIVMNKAGFMQKVKFKFAPVALDAAVTLGADVLVAELMPEKKTAKFAVECLNLAMTKEIIHALPIQEFTNALTGGEALKNALNLVNND